MERIADVEISGRENQMKKNNSIKDIGSQVGSGLSERWKSSALGFAITNFKTAYKHNKIFIYFEIGILCLISIIFSGFLIQLWMWITNSLEIIKISLIPAAWFYRGKLLSLVLFIVLHYYFWYLGQRLIYNYTIDEKRNIKISKDGTYGTNSEMTDTEKKDALVTGDVWDIKWNIYGVDLKNDSIVYSLKNQYGMNNNMSVTGTPGSGKSSGLVIPIIMQTVRREESLIITDPKGELYEQTAEMLRAHGYTVKLLNFGPRLMIHSDSCNFMKIIGKSTLMAHTFARTVIENITGDAIHTDIWGLGGLNLLKGTILYVNMSSDYKEDEKTLATVYSILSENSVEDLECIFEMLPDKHPAKKAFKIYSQGDKVVKGNTLTGLAIQLSVFQDETVCKLTSVDDIQFTEPGISKCVYFVGSSDQEDSMDFLKALFFSLAYQELVSFADNVTLHPESGKKLPVKVTMLLDEFPNCGIIPSFEKKLSTVRSRNIDTIFITQDICQLQNMYPDNRWRTVLNDCSSQMLLQTQDEETAKFFSTRSGTMTAQTNNKRFSESDTDLIKTKLKAEYTITEGLGERPVFTVGEIFTMNINELLLSISTHNVIRLRKYNYWSHPMYIEIGDDKNHQHLLTPITNHVPRWVRELTKDELEVFDLTSIPKQKISEDGSRVIPIQMDDENSPARKEAMARKNANRQIKVLYTKADKKNKIESVAGNKIVSNMPANNNTLETSNTVIPKQVGKYKLK